VTPARGFRRALPAAAAIIVAAAIAGCGGSGGPAAGPSSTAAAPAPAPPAGSARVTVWFSDDLGRLVPERRSAPAGVSRFETAMAELARGPRRAGLVPALPPGTRILGTRVEGGVAVVDLSSAFETGYPPGGAAAELAVVGPIVRTAARASGARRVRILVEGRTPAPTGSQIDFSRPLSVGDLPAAQ
jgi:spore germination protein GerM